MKRCKAAQASVENHVRVFADVKNGLQIAMHDAQEKEAELINIWSDMVKSDPDDINSRNSLVRYVNVCRNLY